MALIVQKYGGSSVSDAGKIKRIARKAIAAQNEGNQANLFPVHFLLWR